MSTRQRRYPKEEFARRGDAIYETVIRPRLKAKDKGKFIAIDIETGEYEIGVDELSTSERLRSRVPDAQIWLMRAGLPYLHRIRGGTTEDMQ